MTAPTFGMQFSRNNDGPIAVIGDDFSKILCIETSEDASPVEFPEDTPVRFSSGDADALGALGTGLLYDQVRGINDQLNGLNKAADVTVVRVAEGVDTAATAAAIAAIVNGADGVPSAVNATPRIWIAGRTAWRPDMDTVNPVVAALQSNLGNFLAIAPIDVDDASAANAIDARETMNSDRLMPVGVAARVYEGETVVTRPMAPRVAGLFVRTDNEHEGKPFEPIANRPIYGLAGTSRKIPFNLLDGSVEGQQLLAADISIVAEGETGVDGAIADGGFVFVGTEAAGSDSDMWQQIHQVRGTDYLVSKMAKITRAKLGPKITADLVESWIMSIAFMLRDHRTDEDILGYTPANEMFTAANNSPEQIGLGTLKLEIGIEAAPSFKLANHEIKRYRPALTGLVQEIVTRLNQIA